MTDTQTKAVPVDPNPKVGRKIMKVVRVVGWTSIGFGLFLLGFIVHQLFITTWFAQQTNKELTAEAQAYFAAAEITEVPYVPEFDNGSPDPPVIDPDQPTLLVEAPPEPGTPFAIITIPSIDRLKDGWTVVEGTSRANLKNGAGHMPFTPIPGQPGNAVIAGHRTTYGAPFQELDTLEPGDLIEVETAIGVHTYEVQESIIVDPTELWVTEPRDGAWLTLSTCNPKFSSRQRLIIFASMVSGPNYEAIVGG
jgi:sortase A